MFIGRMYELRELNRLYETDTFQMPVIYGRRRVGKSTLIREFVKEKKCIYFTAIESSERRNLELLSHTIYSALMPETRGLPPFQTYESAFQFICSHAEKDRLVFVIDEYPYLASSDRGFSSLLQGYIDTYFAKSKLFLILCGSSMSFMANQVLGYQSPLYGRRTAQFLIRPFDYFTSAKFVPSYSAEDKSIVYGITGGIPKYLELIDETKDIRQNIIDLFLKESGYLYEEPSNLLKQELRDSSRYNTVIEAIASGASRVSEIATKAHLDTSAATHCLEVLCSLDLVARESAITEEKNRRKTYYYIKDTMFRFWYRFIPNGIDVILAQNGAYLYDEVIQKELPDFMGAVFETMCSQYIMRKNNEGALPFKVLRVGKWWGTNPVLKREEEIDLVGINDVNSQAIFAECKYRNQNLTKNIFDTLQEKTSFMKPFQKKYYYLFSKSGFSKELIEFDDDALQMVTLQEMYSK